MYWAFIIGIFGSSLIGIIFSLILYRVILKNPRGNKKNVDLSNFIKSEIFSFLKKQYLSLATIAAIIFVILLYCFDSKAAVTFLLGTVVTVFLSLVSSFFVSKINSRALEAFKNDYKAYFNIKFKTGLISGLLTASTGIATILAVYLFSTVLENLIFLSLGIVLVAFFSRLTGSIYAEIIATGSDLNREIDNNFIEDDLKNPFMVSKIAGSFIAGNTNSLLEFFALFSISIIGTILLGDSIKNDKLFLLLPLVLVGASIVIAIISSFFVFLGKKSKNFVPAILRGLMLNGLLSSAAFYFIIKYFSRFNDSYQDLKIYITVIVGIVALAVIIILSLFLTNLIKKINEGIKKGLHRIAIPEISISQKSTLFSVLLIGVVIAAGYAVTGFYGVFILIVGVMSLMPLLISGNTAGIINDNIGEISRLINPETENITDAQENSFEVIFKLTTAIIFPVLLVSLFYFLFQSYSELFIKSMSLFDPEVFIGMIIGGLTLYFVLVLVSEVIGKGALFIRKKAMNQTNKEQKVFGLVVYNFKNISEAATKIATSRSFLPTGIMLLMSLVVGYILGVAFLPGFVIGAMVVGIFAVFSMILSKNYQKNDMTTFNPFKDVSWSLITMASAIIIFVTFITLLLQSKFTLSFDGRLVAAGILILATAALTIFIPEKNE